MNKDEMRSKILKQRDALTLEERTRLSKLILEKLYDYKGYQNAEEIYTYVSFGSEVDTHQLINRALSDGKRVYVPKIISKGCMEFYEIDSLADLIPGKFGILEPNTNKISSLKSQEGHPYKSIRDKKKLMIVPGVCFDLEFHRIGYGGGYYDRYLAEHERIYTIGLAFHCQFVEKIEAEEFDQKLTYVLMD